MRGTTVPPISTMAAGEVREYTYDAAADLGEGQAPTNPAVELVNLRTGQTVAGGATLGVPPVAGTVIAFRVAGVEAGGWHLLRVAFDHTNPRVAGERTVRLHAIEGVG